MRVAPPNMYSKLEDPIFRHVVRSLRIAAPRDFITFAKPLQKRAREIAGEEVLFLSDILPTGYQAAEMGEIQKGETVVVFGAGPVGLACAIEAKRATASATVAIVSEKVRQRRFGSVPSSRTRSRSALGTRAAIRLLCGQSIRRAWPSLRTIVGRVA